MVTATQRKAVRRAYRNFRDDRNLTAQEVADRTGITPPLLSNIENGWREPTDAQRKAIAKVLRVAVSALPTLAQGAE